MAARTHLVLIIDDDEAVGKFAALHLRRKGFRVRRAMDGSSGLAAAATETPDVVVLDHYLPDMTGEDVLAALRERDGTRLVPVIYLTIDGSRQRFRSSMNRGADDFLAKPFTPDELTDAVASQLRKHYARMIPRMDESGADPARELAERTRDLEEQLTIAWRERWQALWEARRTRASVDAKVAERTQALESLNESLRHYGYALAHELKGPLRGVIGYANLLLESHGPALDADGADMLRRIEESGRRMNEFVDALNGLAGMRQTDVHRADLDLSALAHEVAAPMLASVPGTLPRLSVAAGLRASADPVLIRVVLENLLSNAFKYSARTPEPVVEVGRLAGDAPVIFFIRDNGKGFDMRQAGLLFQPFQRLHDRREFAGLGVGLSTVQQIVARHGGRIWCEALPERGATFYFTLQAAARG